MALLKMEAFADYTRLLEDSAAELQSLYQDILINVTSFFRDPEAFEALKTTVFPRLAETLGKDEPLRVWTLGCSTGQEAYSVAMAYAEFAEATGRRNPLQLFATDVNAAGIDKAEFTGRTTLESFHLSDCDAFLSRWRGVTGSANRFATCACSRSTMC